MTSIAAVLKAMSVRSRLALYSLLFLVTFIVLLNVLSEQALYNSLSAILTAAAVGVLVAYVPGIYKSIHDDTLEPGQFLIVGVCANWLRNDGSSVWGWIWKHTGRPEWMLHHWFYLGMIWLAIYAAFMHLKAEAIAGAIPAKTWVVRGFIVTAITSVILLVLVWKVGYAADYPPQNYG